MWPGGGVVPSLSDSDDENARLAATALAAYATGNPAAAVSHPEHQIAALLQLQQQSNLQRPDATQSESPLEADNPPPEPVGSSNEELAESQEEPQVPRGKPEAMAKALGEARIKREKETSSPTKVKKKKKATPRSSRKKATTGPSMDDPVEPMTDAEAENLVKLMEQFCKVPFLAEFSRPVALLHPELMSAYSKIVSHPMDMGTVCRKIRRREYKSTRDVRLDMWSIFCNCIRYHTHPSNKDRAMPSFCSISIHLREYFNSLWQEYMLPSDPEGKTKIQRAAFEKREADRTARARAISLTLLSAKTLEKSAAAILTFLKSGGRVDVMDETAVLVEAQEGDDEGDVDVIVENLHRFQRKLLGLAQSLKSPEAEDGAGDCTTDDFVAEFRKCYDAPDLLQNRPGLRIRIKNRIERIMGKVICPIYEANSRGVNQSSIWGCMAAAIYARESSKKPYWPALVLGIMAPDDQKEAWHSALTDRNEDRLPEKLRTELQAGKKRAEQGLKRQRAGTAERQSYFLVEFMGTHEFIWVKEHDIVENFDPDDDPNQNTAAGNVTKKKRASRASSHDVLRSKTYQTALEEARWALEEFEMQLNDTCGDLAEDEAEDEDDELGYSYGVLCQSDDETEEATKNEEEPSFDWDEANELLATDGRLDFTVAGRKEAKKKATARKKQKADADKAALKKEKADHARKQKQATKKGNAAASKKKSKVQSPLDKKLQKEQKELERRRKKRCRERERVLREEMRKKKRRRTDGADKIIPDKRTRAHAIVKSYLTRVLRTDSVMIGNALTIPSSAIDSTGILGMALAFRAAAGEIILDDQDPSFQKSKAYDLIDTRSPLKSSDRIKRLKEQLELLQKEAVRVKENTARREELTQKALQEEQEIYQNIQKQGEEAKKSDVKKRKKYVKGGKKTSTKKVPEKNQQDAGESDTPAAEQAQDDPNGDPDQSVPAQSDDDEEHVLAEEKSALGAVADRSQDQFDDAVEA